MRLPDSWSRSKRRMTAAWAHASTGHRPKHPFCNLMRGSFVAASLLITVACLIYGCNMLKGPGSSDFIVGVLLIGFGILFFYVVSRQTHK